MIFLLLFLLFKNGPTSVSFSCIFGLYNTIFTTNPCEKMSIQYMALGFEPTTFRSWGITLNHLTRALNFTLLLKRSQQSIRIDNEWIQSGIIWCRKWPLYQLCHGHWPVWPDCTIFYNYWWEIFLQKYFVTFRAILKNIISLSRTCCR